MCIKNIERIVLAETIQDIKGEKEKQKALEKAEKKLGPEAIKEIKGLMRGITALKSLPVKTRETKEKNSVLPVGTNMPNNQSLM